MVQGGKVVLALLLWLRGGMMVAMVLVVIGSGVGPRSSFARGDCLVLLN